MIFRRRKTDPTKALLRALVATRTAIAKLDAIESRIESRREHLLQMALKLDNMGNAFLAKKYIEEAERLKHIGGRISYIKLVMEKLGLSLELSLELKNFNKSLLGIIEVIDILKKLPESTIPEFGITIHELEVNIREALSNINVGPAIGYSPTISSVDAEKILEEARAIAKQKLLGELKSP
ncbi:MAG: hypothetical protein J7K21_03445 [Desulfurococcales archaeon]|nr:hypothetical protein [Desulfurococcales archaeon]